MKYTKDVLGHKYDVGEFSYGVPIVLDLTNKSKLKIGKYCSIADNVAIMLNIDHHTEWISTYPFGADQEKWPEAADLYKSDGVCSKGDVIIGNDVWIGASATILSNVTIGDGAIIAAHAVVTKNVEPYTVVAGNPAQLRKKRFDDATIARLLALRWWDWPVEKLRRNMLHLCSSNVEQVLRSK